MFLPTLYSRTSTGAVNSWKIEIEADSFRTFSGQVEGKIITSAWTKVKQKNLGKANETSLGEQAVLEAQAKWQKKVDSGYCEDIMDIDIKKFIEPMLAKKFEDHKHKLTYPVYSQPKLDGIRCIARKEGLFSRNGLAYYPWPHIMKALQPIFEKYPNIAFDGEMYNHALHDDFNEIASLVKKEAPSADEIKVVEGMLQYHIYDLAIAPNGGNPAFGDRNNMLHFLLNDIVLASSYIHLVETDTVLAEAELTPIYEKYMAGGYEGQMVRANTEYEYKRTDALLKRKEMQDEEFAIVAVEEGVGGRAGVVSAVIFNTKEGKEFRAGMKGSMKFCKKMWEERETLTGKIATVKFQNYTPEGKPRFGKFISLRDYE